MQTIAGLDPSKSNETEQQRIAAAVETIAKNGGGGEIAEAPLKDVNFRDYDGKIVHSYSSAEFAELTELPANPSHKGLTAQGWNWSLEDAQAYVAKCKRLEIGQSYVTDDGKTRIYIRVVENIGFHLGLGVNGTVDVDWGDGTAHDTLTGSNITTGVQTPLHNYNVGNYVITLTIDGAAAMLGLFTSDVGRLIVPESYKSCITKIELGSNIDFRTATNAQGALNNCANLETISIPVEGLFMGSFLYAGCASLKYVVLPHNKYTTQLQDNMFAECHSLIGVSMPNTIMFSVGNGYQNYGIFNGRSLDRIILPDSMQRIGKATFLNAAVKSITIPDSITSIETEAFSNISCMALHFCGQTPPSVASDGISIGYIESEVKIYVPTGSLSAYTSANNYPSSRCTYIEE